MKIISQKYEMNTSTLNNAKVITMINQSDLKQTITAHVK